MVYSHDISKALESLMKLLERELQTWVDYHIYVLNELLPNFFMNNDFLFGNLTRTVYSLTFKLLLANLANTK